MKKGYWVFFSVLLGVLVAGGAAFVGIAAGAFDRGAEGTVYSDAPDEPKGVVYYVDAGAAKDSYEGTTPKQPLKTLDQVNELKLNPGDVVLFKRDCRWSGQLRLPYSGTKEAPIIYGMYGEGSNKPHIAGDGIVNAAVSGKDISFVEIHNLEVSNQGDTKDYHRGISIAAVYEIVEGITIKDCYVHDVDSNLERVYDQIGESYTDTHWLGGIIVRARSPENKDNDDIILRDILIEGNEVDRCNSVGIAAGATLVNEETGKKCEGMVIRGNRVSRSWGDGIILFNSKGGLLEHNVAANNGQSDEGLSNVYVGIWIIWSEDCVIQYNESYGQGLSSDAQGFDIDGSCNGTILQYNYSHDNAGGFLLCMQSKNGKATIRYNVSINDAGSFLKFGWLGGTGDVGPFMDLDVYNNTYFTTQPISEVMESNIVDIKVKNNIYARFRNNIFCVKNGTNATFSNLQSLRLMRFENNCYYGFSGSTIPYGEVNQILKDPRFTFAGTSEEGFDSLGGYKLLADSPCLESGMEIYNDGGLDFWGNPTADAQAMNIGAYIGGAAKRPAGVNIALTQEADMSSYDGLAIMRKQAAAMLVDNKKDNSVSTEVYETAEAEEWFEITLDDTYEISKAVLTPAEDGAGYPVDFSICVRNEAGEWVEVYEKKNAKLPEDGAEQTYTFDRVSTDRVQIRIRKLRETEGSYFAALSEIELYE